jgi:hypothetical protein
MNVERESFDLITLYPRADQQRERGVKLSKERNDDFAMSLNLLEVEFQVVKSRLRWNEFCAKLQNDSTDIFQFNPQSFIISPFCLLYEPPRIFAPSPFLSGSLEALVIFDTLLDFSLIPTHKPGFLFKLSIHDLDISPACQCSIMRYMDPVRSVLFSGADELIILVHAGLDAQGN